MMIGRAPNFNAGPAAMPHSVLEHAAQEMTQYADTGMSVMELSHRSAAYEAIHDEAQARIRSLYGLGDEYVVLFLQGGASTQFAMVPMHALTPQTHGAYVVNGAWGEKALAEARIVGNAEVCASTKDGGYRTILPWDARWTERAPAYVHITTNETIEGVQWSADALPEHVDCPLIADMSSDILSRPLNISPFSLLYAGAQKNIGPSGVTVVIARKSFIDVARPHVPTMLRYDTHMKANSLYNTPPTFAIYMMALVLRWISDNGGLEAMDARSRQRAGHVYGAIDDSGGFYVGHADAHSRSQMNITFRLRTAELEKQFLQEAKKQNFVGLAGHRSVGGIRVSNYNAVTKEAIDAVVAFMRHFCQTHG
jgi:phosphoserine aminotransferase